MHNHWCSIWLNFDRILLDYKSQTRIHSVPVPVLKGHINWTLSTVRNSLHYGLARLNAILTPLRLSSSVWSVAWHILDWGCFIIMIYIFLLLVNISQNEQLNCVPCLNVIWNSITNFLSLFSIFVLSITILWYDIQTIFQTGKLIQMLFLIHTIVTAWTRAELWCLIARWH